jgi:hypothetical protein
MFLRHGDEPVGDEEGQLVIQSSFGCKNAEFGNAYFEYGKKVIKNLTRKKKEPRTFDFAHNFKRWKTTTEPTLFVGIFATFSTQSASNSAFFYTVLIC